MFGISLEVEIVIGNATESGVVRACFSSEVDIPLIRDAVFLLSLSNSSTAIIEQDFVPESSLIAVPTNFSGFFEMCLNITIIDDSIVEAEEIIAYDLLPLSELDTVLFPGNLSSIEFIIIDKDGKKYRSLLYVNIHDSRTSSLCFLSSQ